MIVSRIIGTGSFIPTVTMANSSFWSAEFYGKDQKKHHKTNQEITSKFEEVAGITERRVAKAGVSASDLGVNAANIAIQHAGIDPETLDYIIVAHNFGDVDAGTYAPDLLPNLAAKIKSKLGIRNMDCIAYDVLFGCPSWILAMTQANYYIKAGDAKRILVIGTDTVYRMTDPHDLDGMLFADGAGAAILEATEVEDGAAVGVLTHKTVSGCVDGAEFLKMDCSLNPDRKGKYIRMNGKSVFRFAVSQVPQAIMSCLNKLNMSVDDIDNFVFHQANVKMNKAIFRRLYDTDTEAYDHKLPLVVDKLGNSSAATVPTLLDLLVKQKIPGFEVKVGNIMLFASVGAGMHANVLIYKHF